MNLQQYIAAQDRAAFHRIRRQLQRDNQKQPKELVEIAAPEADPRTNPPKRAWRSRTMLVQLFDDRGHERISINRAELDKEGGWKDGITWDEIQAIKSQIGFGDRWAVEIYPPEEKLINVANIRHIWLLPSAPEYGWKGGEA